MITNGYDFYEDVYELLEEILETGDEADRVEAAKGLPDDFELKFWGTELQSIFKLTPDFIIDGVDEERWTEERHEDEKVYQLLEKYIDFDSINKEMPKLYYQNYRDKSVWTKRDILKYLGYGKF